MKRVALSAFITAFAIIMSFFSGNFIEKKIDTLEKDLDKCYNALIKENISSAEKILGEIEEYWNRNETSIGLFISGEMCSNLEDEIKKLSLLIKSRSTDSALESIGECKNILLSVKEKELLSVDSIL